MADAYTLLNINQDVLKDFHLQANRIDDHQTEKVINQNLRKLKEIESRMLANEGITVSRQSIDEVLYKVVEASHSGETKMEDWTMRELRIVSYYLMKLQNEDAVYNYALTLLDKGWKNMFFNGLVFYVLNSWNMIKPELRKNTCQLITKKLQQYSDSNRRYLMYKNHANFFDEAGPTRLSVLLTSKKQDVREAPQIIGNRPSSFAQSFYSDVIVKYCEKVDVDIDMLEEIFESHTDTRTKKLVFANLVVQADKSGDAVKQTQISKFINRILGDVTLAATWAPFPGATSDEALRLKHAMQLVNLWFARRIIETFFEVCVQDRDRKVFWLKYVQFVSGFKIVGSTMTKRALQNDPRTNTMFLRHFIETNSNYSQTSALVLCIKNKVMVEFSDTGALYVYNQGHNQVKFLRNGVRFMNSTNDLKIPSMQLLIETYDWGGHYYNEEGRMTHQGYWQTRLTNWMRDKVLSNDNTAMSYFETKDDETFVAQELPKEKPILKPTVAVQKPVVETPKHQQKVTARPQPTSQPANRTTIQTSLFEQAKPTPTTSAPVTPIPKAKLAVYETKIAWMLSSKWVFNDTCRVVCNNRGYYVNVSRGQRFVHLRGLMDGTKAIGNIWIKRPNNNGWFSIVHAFAGKEFPVGYLKQGGGGLLYKQDLRQNDFMTIKLQ